MQIGLFLLGCYSAANHSQITFHACWVTSISEMIWTNTYPLILWLTYVSGNKVKENVLKAIQHLEDNTCLRFLRFDDALPDLKFYLRIGKDSAGGCYANIGRMRESKQPQVVSLSGPGCEDVGSVIHELGHIVGLHHEHSRKDRNKYIKVNFKNVRENAMLNFMMMEGVETLAEYDVGSIMHYGTYDFSRNSEPTIEVRDQALSFLAGNRRGLSYYDIKSLSKAYRCTVQCPYRLSCENGGFLHSLKGNTDCFCKCPDGLAGNTCNRIDPRAMSGPHGFCGGVISLSLSWFDRAFIHSPRFPFNYPRRQKCLWLLKGPTGSVIKLSFIYFDIKADSNKCIHWLEVRSNLVGQPGPRYCGRWNGGIIVSKDQHNNMMVVKFDSTEHVGYATTGFAAIASAIVTPDTF
ncbi:protein SpAN-like isoform X1 [Lingula anatina]|uniref:Metalloendopeptidase n=1 Tax=Lingula anatina TaxID=7574 RepID=A0A1S3HTJ0_LINAN|nr:protein SpAN-like isoform X1 [Lingula anatina]|eukprot:XP_013389360.1 protein SpAN-like isoform X1 [Lingula anatina]